MVRVAPQPYCGACEIASTSRTSPPVPAIAPSASNRRPAVVESTVRDRSAGRAPTPPPRLARSRRRSTCQPTYLVRIPPAISPVVPAAAPRPPQIPSALLRSAPSSNMFITIESAAGSMIAPPSPCAARLAISTGVAARERARQRSRREQRQAEHQDPATAEKIRRSTAEQQEAAECQRIRRDHPLQPRRAQMQIATDRRQRDVDDREIDDRHEVRDGEQREGPPAVGISLCGCHVVLRSAFVGPAR